MKHYLTYKDEKSDKFWQIEVNGSSFTVTYGKIGKAGTSQTKVFDSDEKCLKEAEKILNDKLKKGYAKTSEGESISSQPTNNGVGAKLISKKLRYQLQDDDVLDTYLFSIAADSQLNVHFEKLKSNDKGDLTFSSRALGWAKAHIILNQGTATSFKGNSLPEIIDAELPPFLLSRKVMAELKEKGKTKFIFPWGYDLEAPTTIKLKEKDEIKIKIGEENFSAPILKCMGSNEESDEIILWVVDDDDWPLILVHDWDGDYFFRLFEIRKYA
ncbi:MAG: WGR domain-containing protein [Cytophagia bacterium]|nr:WGR domain-containing protein [Cytophagia bacterium]NBW37523.1 WGR domain-containing protein [Cytophagia bacterium]